MSSSFPFYYVPMLSRVVSLFTLLKIKIKGSRCLPESPQTLDDVTGPQGVRGRQTSKSVSPYGGSWDWTWVSLGFLLVKVFTKNPYLPLVYVQIYTFRHFPVVDQQGLPDRPAGAMRPGPVSVHTADSDGL